ncbi:MAG: hypothetical protein WCG55_03370 [bacterium]
MNQTIFIALVAIVMTQACIAYAYGCTLLNNDPETLGKKKRVIDWIWKYPTIKNTLLTLMLMAPLCWLATAILPTIDATMYSGRMGVARYVYLDSTRYLWEEVIKTTWWGDIHTDTGWYAGYTLLGMISITGPYLWWELSRRKISDSLHTSLFNTILTVRLIIIAAFCIMIAAIVILHKGHPLLIPFIAGNLYVLIFRIKSKSLSSQIYNLGINIVCISSVTIAMCKLFL